MDDLLRGTFSETVKRLNRVADDVFGFPPGAIRNYGSAAFGALVAANAGASDPPVVEPKVVADMAAKAEADMAALCATVPRASRRAVESFCMAYTAAAVCDDARFDFDLEGTVGLLLMSAFAEGLAIGELAGGGKVAAEALEARRAFLSSAGRRGAQAKSAKTELLKQWALREAGAMRGADIEIARTLATKVPPEFREASNDPERLIYDLLRSPRSRNMRGAGPA